MKADKLADVQDGADSLGILLEGMHGPDWTPKGNGLLPTHYAPYFTERNGHKQLTVCGEWIRPTEHSTEPTCPTCQAYLQADEAMGDDPFGTPSNAPAPRRAEPDPIQEYEQHMRKLAAGGRR